MTEYQRLFLVQARANFAILELLRRRLDLPICHARYHLQMATELLGKAHAWKLGPRVNTHRAFVGFLRSLATNRKAQKQLGYQGQNDNWEHMIRKSAPLAKRIEDLAPALALDAPNPEFPWPRDAPQFAPAEFTFAIWEEIQNPTGSQFLNLSRHLFAAADAYL